MSRSQAAQRPPTMMLARNGCLSNVIFVTDGQMPVDPEM